jgi:hypothetical protein
VLRAPLEVCVSRARGRTAQPPADPEVVEQLWREFADLAELEANAVDVGAGGPEEAADLVAGRLRTGALAI